MVTLRNASACPGESVSIGSVSAVVNSEEAGTYGVDHVAVAEGLGCKAVRVKSPNEFKEAFATARRLMKEHQVPVVMEFILERVTNVAMGTEISNVNEFEEILCLDPKLSIDDVSGSVLQTDGAKGSANAQNAAPASAR